MMYVFIFVLTFVWNYIIANQSVYSKVLLTQHVVFATFCATYNKILARITVSTPIFHSLIRLCSVVQSQVQQDWNNREFIDVITFSIKQITEFLNAFDMSRQVDYIEARVLKQGAAT